MMNIAVLCKNNREAAERYFELVHLLQDRNIKLTRLIYHQWVVGNTNCRVRFYSATGYSDWIGTKVDMTFGFTTKQQSGILADGVRRRVKYADINKNYTDILAQYFV